MSIAVSVRSVYKELSGAIHLILQREDGRFENYYNVREIEDKGYDLRKATRIFNFDTEAAAEKAMRRDRPNSFKVDK